MEANDRWSRDCAQVFWQIWSGGLEDVERWYVGCGQVV